MKLRQRKEMKERKVLEGLTLKGRFLPVKGEVISACCESADPTDCSPVRVVTAATDARIIMQTSARK